MTFIAVWAFIKRILAAIPWQAYAFTAGLVAGWLIVGAVKTEIRTARRDGHVAGVTETTVAFKLAQDRADAIERAKVAKTTAAQAVINQEKTDALHRDQSSIDARAAAIRLRHDTAAAAGRASGGVDLPAPGEAATRACPAPAQDGLPFTAALDVLTQAAKLQAQLNAILDWEAAQDDLVTYDTPLEPVK